MQSIEIGQQIHKNSFRIKALLHWAVANHVDPKAGVLCCSERASLASQFARAAGLHVYNFASSKSIRAHGLWFWKQSIAVGYQETLVGAEDADLKICPRVEAGFSDLGNLPTMIRQRRIDTFASALKSVSWIHSSHISAIDLIDSAFEVICRDRPILTFTEQALRISSEVLNQKLQQIGYELFDSQLKPMVFKDEHFNSDAMLIAFPQNRRELVEELKGWLNFESRINYDPGSSELKEMIKRYYKRLLSTKSLAGDFLNECLFADNHLIDMEMTPSENLYSKQGDRADNWYWTGPGKQTSIQLCIPSSGYYQFRIVLDDMPGESIENSLRVFLDGRQVSFETVQANSVIEFSNEFSPLNFEEGAMLVLCVGHTLDIGEDKLGVSISKIEMYGPQDEMI